MLKEKSSQSNNAAPSYKSKFDWERHGEPVSYSEFTQGIIDSYFHNPLTGRLDELIAYLERRGNELKGKKARQTNAELAARVRAIAAELEKIASHWDSGDEMAADIAEDVDWYVEEALPGHIHKMLYQLTIEGLVVSGWTGIQNGGNEKFRLAAGLPEKPSQQTEKFIMDIHAALIADPRKKSMGIKAGGYRERPRSMSAKNKARKKAGSADCYRMFLYYYKKQFPSFNNKTLQSIWTHAKCIYKRNGEGKAGREAVEAKYGTLLPVELLNELETVKAVARDATKTPTYFAYKHAAMLAGISFKKLPATKTIARAIQKSEKELRDLHAMLDSTKHMEGSQDSQNK